MKMKKNFNSSTQSGQHQTLVQTEPLNESLEENIRKIKIDLGSSDDIIIREIRIGKERSTTICLFLPLLILGVGTVQKNLKKQ